MGKFHIALILIVCLWDNKSSVAELNIPLIMSHNRIAVKMITCFFERIMQPYKTSADVCAVTQKPNLFSVKLAGFNSV